MCIRDRASFSGFGFPKSHAAAFALLGYQSAWLRHYYPGEYLASLLNAQPMGFYPPAALRLPHQRRRRVEAHRLGVEQRGQVLARVVVAQPGRLVAEPVSYTHLTLPTI